MRKNENVITSDENVLLIKSVADRVVFPGLVSKVPFSKDNETLGLLTSLHKSKMEIGIVMLVDSSKKL